MPIWKKEHYENGDSGWVNCERCAAPTQDQGQAAHARGNEHAHDHADGHDHGHTHSHQQTTGLGDSHQHAATSATAPIPDYSRQMALKEVGPQGQGKLRASRVLVVGCGGLGVPVISYLAGAGIVAWAWSTAIASSPPTSTDKPCTPLADVGKPKVELAAARVQA